MGLARGIVIAAPTSASGKTVVTLGLIRALRDRGMKIASAKVGPDYIDPRFHTHASGRPCPNLDPWAMGRDGCIALLAATSRDTDLTVIEGVMGLFDGPHLAWGSTADLAADLGLPVVLIVDARHQAQSLAALVHGFATYRKDITLAGVIANRIASDRHASIVTEALGDRLLGLVRADKALELPSRHLGLVQADENQDLEGFIASAALAVARETVLDRFTNQARPLPDPPVSSPSLPPLGQTITIARDMAFAFSYPHMIEGWRRAGATIRFFSPLADEAPDGEADAVFLPGGYPELHAGRLASNSRFLTGLRQAEGLIYGECGGYMVLGEGLIDASGARHAMAGLLPLTTSFADRRLHLGYRALTPLAGSPWRKPLRGHEFHYATIASEGAADRLFGAHDASGAALPAMGLRRGRVMGSFAHLLCEAP